MTNITRKVVSGLTTGAILISMSSQIAFADTNMTISGNLQGSDNTANVNMNTNTSVVQSNSAVVTNVVTNNQNTGNNKANDNLGNGGVSIHTGEANATTSINNALNSNSASVSGCGACAAGNTNVDITGNGKNTDNTANLNKNSNVAAFQNNTAVVANIVTNNQNTGGNKTNDNNGGNAGVDIHTGNTNANTAINTVANANAMVIGGGAGAVLGGNTNLLIAGNLKNSDNTVNLNMNKNVLAEQNNLAIVTNDVVNNGNTGDNKANDNLGMVSIHTGAANANTSLNTGVNFNAASIDCGCMMNVNAKSAGNGKNSDNTLNGNFNTAQAVFQGQDAVVGNFENSNLNTGENTSSDNGGLLNGDPYINTKSSNANTWVNTTGNTNVVGPVTGWMLPNGAQVNTTWNFMGMLSFLSMFNS